MVARPSASQRSQDRTTLGVAHHDHQPRPEPACRKLNATDLRRRDDVAGDTNDEEVAKALVEHQFRRDTRVRTSEYDRERLLSRN